MLTKLIVKSVHYAESDNRGICLNYKSDSQQHPGVQNMIKNKSKAQSLFIKRQRYILTDSMYSENGEIPWPTPQTQTFPSISGATVDENVLSDINIMQHTQYAYRFSVLSIQMKSVSLARINKEALSMDNVRHNTSIVRKSWHPWRIIIYLFPVCLTLQCVTPNCENNIK